MADQKISARTTNTNPGFSDVVPGVTDPAGTPLDRNFTVGSMFFGGMSIPYFANSALRLSHPTATVLAAAAAVANRVYVHPAIVPYRRAFTSIACYCGSGQTGNVRMGIYNSVFSEANGWGVGTLAAETTSNAVVAATNSFAISATLDPGLYWLAACFDGTPTMRLWGLGAGLIMGVDLTNGPNVTYSGFATVHTYGALPDLTGVTQSVSSPVIVGIK